MKHEEMSDFEINCAVSRSLGVSHVFWYSKSEKDFCEEIPPNKRGPIWKTNEQSVLWYTPSNGNVFNPCNSWADAGPIIQEFGIELSFGSNTHPSLNGLCMASIGQNSSTNANPLRAAMIVFLMMNEVSCNE